MPQGNSNQPSLRAGDAAFKSNLLYLKYVRYYRCVQYNAQNIPFYEYVHFITMFTNY